MIISFMSYLLVLVLRGPT